MAFSISSVANTWLSFVSRCGRSTAVVVAALAASLLAAVIGLIDLGVPWRSEVLKNFARVADLSDEKQVGVYIDLGVGIGLIGIILLTVLALVTQRWWVRPTAPSRARLNPATPGPKARWIYLACLLVIAAYAMVLRAPRLSHSFWNDEEMAFRKYVWGEYKMADDGTLEFKRVSWRNALFNNLKTNNHHWSTLETRLGMALANRPELNAPPGVPGFQESAARIFPFLSSGLAVLAIGWLGWLLGSGYLGAAAALVLALSPWHIRYSVEIRGYSTMLLMLPVTLGCLIRAIESGRWRWWLSFALAQTICLLSFAGTLFVALPMNVIAALILWKGQDRLSNLLRLGVANVFSGIPLMIMLPPAILQIMAFQSSYVGAFAPMDQVWFLELWAHLTAGIPWHPFNTAGTLGICLKEMAAAQPLYKIIFGMLLPLLAGMGFLTMLWKNWGSRLVAISILAGAVFTCINAARSGAPAYGWYVLFLLPLYCLALPFAQRLSPSRLLWLPLLGLGGVFFLTAKPARVMAEVPRQPIRETTQVARDENTVPTGGNPLIMTGVFGTSDRQVLSYDPRVVVLKSPEDFTALVAKATQAKAPLLVYFCGKLRAQNEDKAILKQLEDPTQWKLKKFIPCIEEMFSYYVYEKIAQP
jgi:hypothetical protein